MCKTNEFVSSFHSIHGLNVKEKWKSFNGFLKSLRSDVTREEELNHFMESIEPTNPMEEIFKIHIMMELKLEKFLLHELKLCNRLFVVKLLKDWRLFGEIFSKITADELINDILPHLSYSLKLKLLNGVRKNVKNESLLDQYFVDLEGKYGLKMATQILPGCSMDLVRSKVKKFYIKLSQPHLKGLFKKDKRFLEFYFDTLKEKYEKINFSYHYPSVLKYVAKVDPNIYWKLHERYDLTVKFGKYMTPSMIKSHDDVVREGRAAFDMFNQSEMFKTMKKEGKIDSFLLNLYPETPDRFIESLNDRILQFIKRESRNRQYHLISSSFTRKYNKDMLDFPNYFTEELLKITPIKERERILDIKVKEDEQLYYLYKPEVSIPVFKKHLQHSLDANTRNQYAVSLYQTCLINRDTVALLEVLRYILKRHKNDISFLNVFFSKVLHWPKVIDLSEEHWEYMADINEMLEISSQNYYLSSVFTELYICHLIKNNKPFYKIVKKNVEEVAADRNFLFITIKDERYRKIYWDELSICINSYKDEAVYNKLCIRFLNSLCFQYKPKQLPLHDYEAYLDELNTVDWDCLAVIKMGVKFDINKIHALFWTTRETYDNEVVLWYAKHRPEFLQQHITEMFSMLQLGKAAQFFRKLNKFCNPDIIEEIKAYALESYRKDTYEQSRLTLQAISILFPQDFFLELINPMLQSLDGRINLRQSTDTVLLQQTIARSLQNVRDTSKTYPVVLKFCVGDYLKFGLPSLYSITYNTPESNIKEFLNKLSDTAVSVRKHVLNLSRYLFTVEDFHELLEEWSEKEKNLSMRNILLKKTVEYFDENPSERIWLLLKNNLKAIDPEDREMYDFLLKLERIPLEYLSQYLEAIYEAISQNPDQKIKEKKFDLLNEIPTGIIKKLNNKFLKRMIRDTVCNESNTNFHWKCVFHAGEDRQSELFEENFIIFKNYVEKNSSNMKNPRVRSKVAKFLFHFLKLAIELKRGHLLVRKFMIEWSSILESERFQKDYMLVQFTDLYFESEFNTYKTGVKINKLFYDYVDKYDASVIDSFCGRLREFLRLTAIEENEKELFKFVDGFFHEKKDRNIFVAVLHFLPKVLPEPDNAYAKYIPILETIEKCESTIVRYHFDDYLSIIGLEATF